jgi:dephospho-CoA kinase
MKPADQRTNEARTQRNTYAVALTGGIGSGKSAVSDLFSRHGATVIDADDIAHALTAPDGRALPAIVERFGEDMLDRAMRLNRAALRERVFTDPHAKRDLEAILHPLIRSRMIGELESCTAPYAVLAIPLLVETGQTELADRVLVVDAPEPVRIQRVCRRSGLTPEEVVRIIDTQATVEERLAVADDIIDNSGDLTELATQVARLHERYLSLASVAS